MCTYTRGCRCQSAAIDWRDQFLGVCTGKKMKFLQINERIILADPSGIEVSITATPMEVPDKANGH